MVRFLFLFFLAFTYGINDLSAQCTSTSTVSINVDATTMLESSGVIKVTASLSSANSEDIHVSFKFDGTAVFDTDYSFSPNEGINSPKLTNTDQYYIIIPAGQTQKTVNITAIDDSNIEVEETIEIEIGEVSDCASIGTSKKKNLRLLDDDLVISLVLLSGEDTVLEEEGSLKSRLQVTANANVPEDVEVLINFSPITASSSDVVFTSTVKIDDGTSNSSPFDIYALDDAVYEDNESFYLTHTILSGTGTISNDTISFSITDNEPPLVSFSIDKTEIDEDGGEAILTITLSRTYDQDSKVALNYEGLNFTAENNVDFQSDKSDVITISAGNTQSTVKISAIDDQIEDPNENIVIQLNNVTSNPASENISFTPQSVTIKINDDENPPVAVADTYDGSNCVDEGGTLTISDPAIGLLANDYDPEGGPLSIKVKAPTILGLIQCNGLPGICSDGTFQFVHQGAQTLDNQVNFSYEIEDEDGFKAVGLVTICVNPINDAPFISNGAIQVNEGETITRDFTTGIQDEEYTLGLDNAFSFQIITQPTKGTATLTSDGILTYVAPDFLSGGNPFNTSIKYEYTDNGGLTTTDIVPITISNTVPVPVADTFYVGVGQTINISAPGVLANDPSPANSVSRSYISASPK